MTIFRLTNGDDLITYFLCGEVGKVVFRSLVDQKSTTEKMNREQVWEHWHAQLENGYVPAKISKLS